VIYTITREGNKLFGQRTGRAREELLPLCEDTFYRKGVWRGEKVFERDSKGKVIRMLDRRENNDLVWRKVK
jgi:ribosomal 30S subunit maturation factor RimM